MDHLPLNTLDDEFATNLACAVCGEFTLAVVHVEDLPDYVKCTNCESAFILSQGADWAMFGSISSDYPGTEKTVLKRWTTLEAVQAMANSERAAEVDALPSEGADLSSDSTPAFGIGGDSPELFDSEQAPTPPFGLGELDDFVADSANGSLDPAPMTFEPLEEIADVSEPEPGQRYVVTLAQKTAVLPSERCAHCLRRPAPRKLLVHHGPDPKHGYRVPLCQSCHKRERAQRGAGNGQTDRPLECGTDRGAVGRWRSGGRLGRYYRYRSARFAANCHLGAGGLRLARSAPAGKVLSIASLRRHPICPLYSSHLGE